MDAQAGPLNKYLYVHNNDSSFLKSSSAFIAASDTLAALIKNFSTSTLTLALRHPNCRETWHDFGGLVLGRIETDRNGHSPFENGYEIYNLHFLLEILEVD